jgi:hypothetical protein
MGIDRCCNADFVRIGEIPYNSSKTNASDYNSLKTGATFANHFANCLFFGQI